MPSAGFPNRPEDMYCCDGSSPEDVVISGMSGRFPSCENIEQLSDGLYNMKDLNRDVMDRWDPREINSASDVAYNIADLSGFDSDFFGVPRMMADMMEPDQRILLEVAYEAIADSGYNPRELRGRNIGVYCASTNMDSSDLRNATVIDEYYFSTSSLESMRANRISYHLDFKGPSLCIDSACSTSSTALSIALQDMRRGYCDEAVVCGTQLNLNADLVGLYNESGIMCNHRISYPFEERSSGMVRGEAVAAIFLQKAKLARRCYAKVVSVIVHSSGYVPEGISHPSYDAQVSLFRGMLEETGVDPHSISYIEAHGTGTIVGDPIEISSLNKIYCQNRKEPLLVGTVKSNLGHTESTSGLSSIIKMILTFETGFIPPQYNFVRPSPVCKPLMDGVIRVVNEVTPFVGECTVINSFGFGGTIGQVMLRKNLRERNDEESSSVLPQLILYSATTEENTRYGLQYVVERPFHRDFSTLVNNLAFEDINYKNYRGYVIHGKQSKPEVKHCGLGKREIWFVMTGMGCQWPGMGYDLMAVESFARSIRRSALALKPYGIDLLKIMKSESDELSQKRSILPAFVSICAIQIALIDLLQELGIHPDGIVGHSVGELACAYADGCCTAEEVILSAYWRGYCTENSNLPEGAMAAVGMTWEEAEKLCPKDVYAACHNAEDSVTISGHKQPLENFVSQLKKENRFARIVDTYGYSFHSPMLAPAAPMLKENLLKAMPRPKNRTSRWLSTSYPPEEWKKPEAAVADAAYFVHNLISKVRFAEALAFVPRDAIVIEIGPHFLLQSLLKRVIGKDALYFGLMKRNENNVDFLLTALGNLYSVGLNPRIELLYPVPKYPVPRSTPTISNFIKWNHDVKLSVPKWEKSNKDSAKIMIDAKGADHYILDHCVGGRSLFPAAGYVHLVWTTLAKQINRPLDCTPILIEDFRIHRASILSPTDKKVYSVSILNTGGEFEIVEGKAVIATGRIMHAAEDALDFETPVYDNVDPLNTITGKEVYSELRINGYEYGPSFQSLMEATIDGSKGLLKWTNDWIPYLDAHLLFFGLLHFSDLFHLPTWALSIKIDPKQLKDYTKNRDMENLEGIPVNFEKYTKRCRSPGVEICNLRTEPATRSSGAAESLALEELHFVPYVEECAITDKKKKMYDEYTVICCEIVQKIAVQSKQNVGIKSSFVTQIKDFDTRVDNFINNHDESYVLLNALLEFVNIPTSDNFLENVKATFDRYLNICGEDILYKSMLDEYPLRHVLSTVIENSPNRLSAVEVANGSALMSPLVRDITKSMSTLKMKLTLLHPEPEILDNEIMSEKNIDVETFKFRHGSRIAKDQDLVMSSFFFGDFDSFRRHVALLGQMIHLRGFILLLHRERISPAEAFLCSLCGEALLIQSVAEAKKVFNLENLTIVSKKSDSYGLTLYLLRKSPQSYSDFTVKVLDGNYNRWVGELKTSFVKVNDLDDGRLWVVAEDTPFNGIVGMAKCLNKEPGGEKLRCVFNMDTKNSKPFNFGELPYRTISESDLFMNVYKNGAWGSFQSSIVSLDVEKKVMDNVVVRIQHFGDLSSFQWRESPLKYRMKTERNKVLFYPYYCALNFKDVMFASGKINHNLINAGRDTVALGMEYSGISADGRRLIALHFVPQGITSSIFMDPTKLLEFPSDWSLEDASTVSSVYMTCYYSLFLRCKLSMNDTILIHSGTGGIGIAAIRIALSLNCKVFVTVGTSEKRAYLRKLFPEIDESHIASSRDTSFEDMVLTKTHGKGVRIVLNSLTGDKFEASMRCLAEHGHFVELGKYDFIMDHKIGSRQFLGNISFHGIGIDKMTREEDHENFMKFREMFIQGMKDGVVKPIDRVVFQAEQVEDAFRYMAAGKHIGKVVLKIRDEPERVSTPKPVSIYATPKLYFYSHKSYIVVGGLGGFGLELVHWLYKKGANHIVITSRHGAQTGYHRLCLQRWKENGIDIRVSCLNVAIKTEAKQLLQEVERVAPVGGIFNSAVVLKDCFIENQSAEDFEDVCAPKAEATKNLDKLSRIFCPSLDFFVCFSSISCGKGNAGQSNYGYANSVMERVCERRRSDGLHGLCIQWGIIGDVGVVHRHMGEDATIAGVVSQRVKSCLKILSKYLLRDDAVLSSYNVADVSKKRGKKDDFLPSLAKIFGYNDIFDMNTARTFVEMGMDSMMGIELQQLLENKFDISLSLKEMQKMNISDLHAYVEAANAQRLDKGGDSDTTQIDIPLPKYLIPTVSVLSLNDKATPTLVFIVHHSETELKMLQRLASEIKYTVFGLLCGSETSLESLSTIATSYLQDIKRLCDSKPFHLIGYSSGATLALEMTSQCQNCSDASSRPSSLTILDGCVELVDNMTSSDESTEDEASSLMDFLRQFSSMDLSKIKQDIEKKPDFQSQTDFIVSLLTSSWQSKFAKGEISDAVRRYVAIRKLLRKPTSKQQIAININVIEATSRLLPNDVSLVKSSLTKICNGKVTINRIPGGDNFLFDTDSAPSIVKAINSL